MVVGTMEASCTLFTLLELAEKVHISATGHQENAESGSFPGSGSASSTYCL